MRLWESARLILDAGALLAPPERDLNGSPHVESAWSGAPDLQTQPTSAETCDDWKNASTASGYALNLYSTSKTWMNPSGPINCGASKRLLCIEQ